MKIKKKLIKLTASLLKFKVDKAVRQAIWLESYNSNKLSFIFRNIPIRTFPKGKEIPKFHEVDVKPQNIPSDKIVWASPALPSSASLFLLHDAIVVGKHPTIYTHEGFVVKDLFYYADGFVRLKYQLSLNFRDKIAKLFSGEKCKEKLDCGIVLTSNWNHYGHWMTEHVMNLRRIENLRGDYPTLKIIVEEDVPPWKIEVITALGFSADNILRWQNNRVFIDKLFVPTFPFPNYDDLTWLSSKLIRYFNPPEDAQYERIYLSRERYKRRSVENENSVVKLLTSMGFKTIYPETLSLKDQVTVFYNAKIIVGPHGSAFTNTIFSQHCKILEFYGTNVALAFYTYAQVLGHDHFQLYCSDNGGKNSNMQVNLKDLEDILNEIINS